MSHTEDHGYHSMGKYSCARDSILSFLCLSDWANESNGNVEAPTGYFSRISNTTDDVSFNNGEFNSIMDEWILQNPEVTDSESLRAELVGHFIVQSMDSGFVYVGSYETEEDLIREYVHMSGRYDDWEENEQ